MTEDHKLSAAQVAYDLILMGFREAGVELVEDLAEAGFEHVRFSPVHDRGVSALKAAAYQFSLDLRVAIRLERAGDADPQAILVVEELPQATKRGGRFAVSYSLRKRWRVFAESRAPQSQAFGALMAKLAPAARDAEIGCEERDRAVSFVAQWALSEQRRMRRGR